MALSHTNPAIQDGESQQWEYSIGKLTQEQLRKLLHYDPITGFFTWLDSTNPNRIKNGTRAGHERADGYTYICIRGYYHGAHTLAWLYVYGEYCRIDHKDNIPAHNWIDNLRKATASQNAQNRCVICNNSGAKGVFFTGKKYKAGIRVNGARIHLGTFSTLEEAANAYKEAAIKYFGEFANV